MKAETIATCREALQAQADYLDEYGYQWGNTIEQQMMARINAAIADLAQPAPQPLDMPDGAGWWAYEDDNSRWVAELTKWDVSRHSFGDIVTYHFAQWECPPHTHCNIGAFQRNYPGKWTRLHMPWDAPQPAPVAMPSVPVFRQTIETERNIGFIEGVLEGVKTRIRRDQPVLQSQEHTIKRCDEVLAWLQAHSTAGGDNA